MNFICGIIGCTESAEYYGDEIYLCDAHAFETGCLDEEDLPYGIQPSSPADDYEDEDELDYHDNMIYREYEKVV